MKHTDTLKRLNAVMKDINGDNTQILRTLQDQIAAAHRNPPEYEHVVRRNLSTLSAGALYSSSV